MVFRNSSNHRYTLTTILMTIAAIVVLSFIAAVPQAQAAYVGQGTASDYTAQPSDGMQLSISVPSDKCGHFVNLVQKVTRTGSLEWCTAIIFKCVGYVGVYYSNPGLLCYAEPPSGNDYTLTSRVATMEDTHMNLNVNILKTRFIGSIEKSPSVTGTAYMAGNYNQYVLNMNEVTMSKYNNKIKLAFTNQGAPYNIYYRVNNLTSGAISPWFTQSSAGANDASWVDQSVGENTSYSYMVEYTFDHNVSIATRNLGAMAIDTIPPSGTIDAPDVNKSLTVTLDLEGNDAIGVSQMRFSTDNTNWSAWETYSTQKSYTVPAEGNYTVYVQYRDAAGNVSVGNISTSFLVDTTAPTGSIETSTGLNYVGNTVQLVLDATDNNGISQMRVAQESDFSGSAWQDYTGSYLYSVSGADGPKILYVKYRDAAGNESTAYTLNVIKDTVGPANCAISLQGKEGIAGETKSQSITVVATGEDVNGLYGIQVSNDNSSWSPLVTTKVGNEFQYANYLLTEGRGIKTVYVRILDVAGNFTLVSDSIKYDEDTTLPSCSLSVSSPDGSTIYTINPAVNLVITANDNATFTDSLQIRLSNNGILWSAYQPYAATVPWNLVTSAGGTNTEGTKTIYLNVRDEAGNVGYATATISYSSTKPLTSNSPLAQMIANCNDPNLNVTYDTIDGEEYIIANQNVIYVPLDLDNSTTSYRTALSGQTWGEWTPFTPGGAQEIGLGLGEGIVKIKIQGKNANGALSDEYMLRFIVDHTAPVCKNLSGLNGATATKTDSISLIADVTDNLSSKYITSTKSTAAHGPRGPFLVKPGHLISSRRLAS